MQPKKPPAIETVDRLLEEMHRAQEAMTDKAARRAAELRALRRRVRRAEIRARRSRRGANGITNGL